MIRPDLDAKRLLKISLEKPELAAALLLAPAARGLSDPSNGVFLSSHNMRGMLGFLPETAIVAIGVTLLMICGEFDLSVGSVFALMPMSMAVLMAMGGPFAPAMLAGLAVCAAIGFINGWLTIRFAIPIFITTLGMLFMARSLTVVISGGFPPLLHWRRSPNCLFTSAMSGRASCSACPSFGSAGSPSSSAFCCAHQLRQLGARDRRLPARGGGDGHPDRAGQDRLLYASAPCSLALPA